MTSLELTQQGVEWVWKSGSLVSIRGPETAVKQAQEEVMKRAESMGSPPQLRVRNGFCDACGEKLIGYQTGGWCQLCTLGRRVALKRAGMVFL